jgi:hypothetical protein
MQSTRGKDEGTPGRGAWGLILALVVAAASGCDLDEYHDCTATPAQIAYCQEKDSWVRCTYERQMLPGGGACFPDRICEAFYCSPGDDNSVSDSLQALRVCVPDYGT